MTAKEGNSTRDVGDEPTPVVQCFLRRESRVLLLKRSDAVGTFPGRWGGVSGFVESGESPETTARREIREEIGVPTSSSSGADTATDAPQADLVRAGSRFVVDVSESTDDSAADRLGTAVAVHPFLFDVTVETVRPNAETETHEWVHPTAILRRQTVPDLWRSYTAVAPTVRSIVADDAHGSTTLSYRALEVLRDLAGRLATDSGGPDEDGGRSVTHWDELTSLARRLRDARPTMAVVANRVNRAMSTALDAADPDPRTPAAVEAAAIAGIERARGIDRRAARRLADRLEEATVLTLSRSGTVEAALRETSPAQLFVAESRPGTEGIDLAESLATPEAAITVLPDAAVAHVLAAHDIDAVVVGADAVLSDGRVVNKTGTRGAALAAREESVPVYAATSTDKIRTENRVQFEDGDRRAVYDGEAPIDVTNPTVDVTPAACITVLSERGPLDSETIATIATEHRRRAAWTDDGARTDQ